MTAPLSGGGLLREILRDVSRDLARRKEAAPAGEVRARAKDARPAPSFVEALRAGSGPRVIAEIKRRSPSRGAIRPDLDPVAIAQAYEDGGAAAISVLTEESRFGGSLDDLAKVASATTLPVLRKDFIVDPYQIWEARAAGAAAILLIARALPGPILEELYGEATTSGLAVLFEVHTAEEAAALHLLSPEVVGVNNRNLDTLKVSLETARSLAPCLPAGAVKVAESGIRRPADLASLEAYGYEAFLVGEALMAAGDPGAALRALIRDPQAVDSEG